MIWLHYKLSIQGLSVKLFCSAVIILVLPQTGHALEWQDLWQTPDQRGQKAFQQQQYEQAAGQFDNPDWKAAAQFKAGQYDQVLDTLKDIQTSEGFYNKGNAHVKQGQLKEALEAYEKSLEISPENADAQYNKELIEKELEKQKQQQNQQQDQGDSSDQDQDQNQEQQNDSGSKDQQGEQEDQSDSGQEQKQDQQESESQGESQQNGDQKESESQPEQAESQPEESDESESAEEAQSSEPSEKDKTEEDAEASAPEPSTELKDESEQASEQWLKRIPDDPAGLLKRKFEYQYKRRKGSRSQQENW